VRITSHLEDCVTFISEKNLTIESYMTQLNDLKSTTLKTSISNS